MVLKNFNFNQKPKLKINGTEYIASNIISGVFHIYNKSQITLKDVWYKDNRNRTENSLKFPEFSLVELYYGDDLAFFGVNKIQKGGSLSPFNRKDLTMTVIDFKEWLNNKPMDFPIYNKSPEWVVNKVISTLGEKRIIVGKIYFSKTENIKAYSAKTKNAYDILRMIEKKTQSILQIVPNAAGQLVVNFFTKDSAKINKAGIQLDLSTQKQALDFYEKYDLTRFDWEEDLVKFANQVRVESERALSETMISLSFNLNNGDASLTLLKPVGKIEKSNVKLYEADGTTLIRKLVVVSKDEADKGKLFDLAYSQNSNTITIGQRLIGKNQVVKFQYFPIVKLEYEMTNLASQQKIASYSGTNGILFRSERHNDETSPADLIALGKGYLAKNSEPRISLKINSRKPIWDLGEHTKLDHYLEPFINGEYIIYKISINQVVDDISAMTTSFQYELMSSLDFDEDLNKHDSQAYRSNPIYETSDITFDTRIDIQENLEIVVQNFACEELTVNKINSFLGFFKDTDREINFLQLTGPIELTNLELNLELGVHSITMPQVTTVAIGTFEGATTLRDIDLPTATEIKGILSVFTHPPIHSLKLPKVTTIADGSFANIKNDATATITLLSKFNTVAEKDRIFGGSNWDQITFIWV